MWKARGHSNIRADLFTKFFRAPTNQTERFYQIIVVVAISNDKTEPRHNGKRALVQAVQHDSCLRQICDRDGYHGKVDVALCIQVAM